VVATVRTLWEAVEDSEAVDRTRLKRDIAQVVRRLKSRIEGRLTSPAPRKKEPSLFDGQAERHAEEARVAAPAAPRFSETALRLYDKDLVEHALQHLPSARLFGEVTDFRDHLVEKIRFNSQATRRRAANYIINRFFPGKVLHEDLTKFAAVAAGGPALADALFYLTCRTELILASVAEEVVFPALAQGGIGRGRILEFVESRFPGSKSVKDVSQAIVRTYERLGVGTATRTRLNVSLREGSLAAFGYMLHLEFPEPGMYSFERLLDGPLHKWLLWDQQWMVRQLYRLREAGLLAKVSEIDRLRQFTTKYDLVEAIDSIVRLAQGTHS